MKIAADATTLRLRGMNLCILYVQTKLFHWIRFENLRPQVCALNNNYSKQFKTIFFIKELLLSVYNRVRK